MTAERWRQVTEMFHAALARPAAERAAFLVTELLDGETLRDRISRAAMPPLRACEVASAIARSLAAAHGKGVVHRDLKPENVVLGPGSVAGRSSSVGVLCSDETRENPLSLPPATRQ